MLAQVLTAEPRFQCGRHAALLAAAVLIAVVAPAGSTSASVALLFAAYGALHGVAVVLCLEPRPAYSAVIAFVPLAAFQCGVLARVGLWVLPRLGGIGLNTSVLVVVAVGAFLGALGYAALLRGLLRYRLATGPLFALAFACACAAGIGLELSRSLPLGGTAWVAVLWWLLFSSALCDAAHRRDRATNALN